MACWTITPKSFQMARTSWQLEMGRSGGVERFVRLAVDEDMVCYRVPGMEGVTDGRTARQTRRDKVKRRWLVGRWEDEKLGGKWYQCWVQVRMGRMEEI
jgi:hypothetical protein